MEKNIDDLKSDFIDFIFGSKKEMESFINHKDQRFSDLKNQQIKSLYLELKEDSWKYCWRNIIPSKLAFSLGNFESYLTQGYQKHIHNITKKYINKEDGNLTFFVSRFSLTSNPGEYKFVEEHRENQFKVINHISENISNINWREFFDIIDEARKCNIVTNKENSKLQPFQLESGMGQWKSDYQKSGITLLNLIDSDNFLDFFKEINEIEKSNVVQNLEKLARRNFSGTKGIINDLISIIQKEIHGKKP